MASKKRILRSPISLGNKVYIRTVTHHYTGLIVVLTKDEIVLGEAAWIADSGRWCEALSTGKLLEVEPYSGLVSVSRGALCDVTVWDHALPREVK